METKITDENFDTEVVKHQGKYLLDFWAPWCGPCKIMGPILEEFAKDLPANIKVGKLNVDENGQTSQKFGIMSIPTLIVFENGKAVKRVSGIQSKEALQDLIS